jgi:heme exporter protein A
MDNGADQDQGPKAAPLSPALSFTAIRCEGVIKRYGDMTALRGRKGEPGFDLSLSAGAITAIVGPNGAGKSTLVGILAGSVRPSAGRVYLSGDGGELPLERQHVGLVAHATLLYGDFSARENLRFYAKLYGCDEGAVEAAISRCGIKDNYANRPTRTYSRGMAQRTAIARAILHRPRLLLCDEPYTGLDPEGAKLLSDILKERRDAGSAVVLVTHDLETAASLCNRAVVLQRGQLLKDLPAPLEASALRAALIP